MARKKVPTADRMIDELLSLPLSEADLLLQFLGAAHRARVRATSQSTTLGTTVGRAVKAEKSGRARRLPITVAPGAQVAGDPGPVAEDGE